MSFLSSEKRELLQQLLKEKGIATPPPPGIPRRKASDLPVASYLQEGLWFLDQLDPGKATYNVPGATRITGALDVSALEKALSEIIRRHETLRTTFTEREGQLCQIIAEPSHVTLCVISLESLPAAEREAEMLRLATEESQRAFDLREGPLFRFFLVKLSREEHILILNMHHIITDGWSMGVFTRELLSLYEAYASSNASPLPEPPIQYADWAIWQKQWLQGENLETQLDFWKTQLRGKLPVLELPTDRPRPAFQSCRGMHATFSLPKSLSDALRSFTQREDFTLFETLLAAFKALLSYYSGQQDIIVGSPSANRNRRELEGLIGYFVNMLPLRSDLSGNPSFLQLLDQVHRVTMAAYAHQELPFGKLVEELKLPRDPSRNPVFQAEFILLSYEHAPAVYGYGFRSPVKKTLDVSGLTLTPVEVESGVAKFDLVVLLWDMPEGISGTFEYNADLFDPATITRMMTVFETLLKNVVSHPEVKLEDLRRMLFAREDSERRTRKHERKMNNLKKIRTTKRRNAISIARED